MVRAQHQKGERQKANYWRERKLPKTHFYLRAFNQILKYNQCSGENNTVYFKRIRHRMERIALYLFWFKALLLAIICQTYKSFLQFHSYICVFLKIPFWIAGLPSSRLALKPDGTWWKDARGIPSAEVTDIRQLHPVQRTMSQCSAFKRDQKQVPRAE